ncbi:MAG: efflux RND transporter permease subunit, partial [Herpetosiphon sp.]|nr:efflux RND transporter permease subunit [Herpetosiphon sp.]
MLWLTRQSLKRPSITILITVALIVAGLVSATGLKQELFPDISFPVVTIRTIYPGASSETMDQDVSAVIEKAAAGVPGVEGVQSTSSESFAFTVLTFGVDTDPKVAKANVQEKLSSIQLPANAQEPVVGTFDFNSLPIVVASVSGENLSDVQERVANDLVPAISAISGVNNVAISGGTQDKVIVTLDPTKMSENSLSQAQVVQFLQANNLAFPVGTVEDSGRTLPLRITHKYSSTAEMENVVVGIKGVNLGGGGSGFGGSGFGAAAPAAQPTARPTAQPTQTAPVTSTAPVSTTLIPAPFAAAGITSPDQITPQVIAQIPDQALSQISLPLALALSDESKTALAQRLPAPQVPAQLTAAGITSPDQITPQVIARFPAAAASQLPVNLVLA